MNPSLIALPWMLCFLSLYLLIFLFIHVGALQNPNPEAVVQEVQRRVNSSISRRLLSSTSVTSKDEAQCLTGNTIDDCWRCDSDWENNRQKLADCAVGFGQAALGGKGGQIYLVNDNSDSDVVNPTVGTLRHAVIQTEPLWIVFSGDMLITLKHELVVGSFKTIDGRGANVQITGGGCVVLQNVNNIVIHSVSISKCVPTGKVDIRLSPTQVEHRGKSDGDGITVRGSNNIWIDHCALSDCTDGLIDVTEGSTAVTISNCYFTHHDKVMLLGHSDDYDADKDMQVTVAFNYFGEGLTQRLPRCRLGYIHIVNNVYSGWGMYAIGGSANPTINSQGNRYTAPANSELKEVTRRMDADNSVWASWNWRSDGDTMVNGAFFTPSGEGIIEQYTKASSLQPKPADLIDQLTMTAGALIGPSGSGLGFSGGGGSVHGYSGGGLGFSGEGGNVHGYSNGNPYDIGMAPPPKSSTLLLSLLIISLLILYLTTNDGALL